MSTRPRRRDGAEPATDSIDFGILLTVALETFKERLHAHLARAGFTDLGPSFGFVFRSLAERPLSLGELAQRLGISSQGALKVVIEMIERGYVERRTDTADARVRRLSLTARGEKALAEARRFHARTEQTLIQALGTGQVASARRVLEALAGDPAAAQATRMSTARPF